MGHGARVPCGTLLPSVPVPHPCHGSVTMVVLENLWLVSRCCTLICLPMFEGSGYCAQPTPGAPQSAWNPGLDHGGKEAGYQ